MITINNNNNDNDNDDACCGAVSSGGAQVRARSRLRGRERESIGRLSRAVVHTHVCLAVGGRFGAAGGREGHSFRSSCEPIAQ